MRRTARERVAALLLLAALFACTPRPPPPDHLTLKEARFADLPEWQQDATAAALPAFARSCAVLAKAPPATRLGVAGRAEDWRAPCAALPRSADDAQARRYFESWFRPWQAGNNGAAEGLFTGYYEPELKGARQPGDGFDTPLLQRPKDLVTVNLGRFRPELRGEHIAGRVEGGRLEPYATRGQIESGALGQEAQPLLWVADPVDAFFLQIQGSGRVVLRDGSTMRVGYDGQNGWPYVAIGRLLIERGALTRDAVSLQSIRAWIKAHPAEGKALMDEDASYVFFRRLAGDGPLGSEGVALTPGRSLAVDRRFMPLGAPVYLDAGDRLRRLMVAQDTGGAIRGPVRGDVFWGPGAEAEARAGAMKARGRYFLLLPKSVTPSP
ncbi:MAG TPA: murein transglycosylase A [Stellaceae bacterium]|nr:murein transglycosylase A [Stellaceae bacterium]